MSPETTRSYDLAMKHLEKVLEEQDDWLIVSTFGFYCMENSVMAAASHFGIVVPHSHRAKASAATELATQHGLEDISQLLSQLNEVRKSEAYGDIEAPELDIEAVVLSIETYFYNVKVLVSP